MHKSDTLKKVMSRSISGAIMITAFLAGCEPKAAAEPPKQTPPKEDTSPGGGGITGANDAVGGILFLANGDLVVVDAAGNKVAPCQLPDPDRNPDDAAGRAECQKVRDTTIIDLQSIAVVRHTGSQCLTVGPSQTVSAGGVVTGSPVYQLPPGCAN